MQGFIEFTTKENTKVWVRRDQITGVEEFTASMRSEPYIKVYIPGFSFSLSNTTAEEFFKQISSPDQTKNS